MAGLRKERARLLREIGKRKRLIEQARGKAARDDYETAGRLGPLFLRQQALTRELTALFDALEREERPARARNVLGKLKAALQQKGLLEPALDEDEAEDEQPPESSSAPPSERGRSARTGRNAGVREVASAPQPDPERRSQREIFRGLVRAAHPDQARSEAERAQRTEVMKDVTRAYERGDLARLLELEAEWQSSNVAAPGQSDPELQSQELERTNRELLKQVRNLTRELRDVKDAARYGQVSHGSIDRAAARAARDLAGLEALCELVREFKIGRRTLAELALGQSLI